MGMRSRVEDGNGIGGRRGCVADEIGDDVETEMEIVVEVKAYKHFSAAQSRCRGSAQAQSQIISVEALSDDACGTSTLTSVDGQPWYPHLNFIRLSSSSLTIDLQSQAHNMSNQGESDMRAAKGNESIQNESSMALRSAIAGWIFSGKSGDLVEPHRVSL